MRRSPHALLLAAFVLACVTAAARPAAAFDDFFTPRSLAMGESLRGDASGLLGPLLNPAGMPLRRAYNIEAMYGFRVQDTGSNFFAGIVDSVTSRVAAGVWYGYVHSSPKFGVGGLGLNLQPALFNGKPSSDGNTYATGTRDGHETGLALALPVGEWFSFGLSAKYLRIATSYPNPAYNATSNPGAPQSFILDSTLSSSSADGFTMDVGANVRLGQSLSLGVVGYNLIPLRSREAPMALGTGLAYHYGTALTLALDYVVNFNQYKECAATMPGGLCDPTVDKNLVTHKLGGGLEWLIRNVFALRAGAVWDSGRPSTSLTFGLAYVGQSFAVDVSYKQQVEHGVESLIVGGIRVFLQ